MFIYYYLSERHADGAIHGPVFRWRILGEGEASCLMSGVAGSLWVGESCRRIDGQGQFVRILTNSFLCQRDHCGFSSAQIFAYECIDFDDKIFTKHPSEHLQTEDTCLAALTQDTKLRYDYGAYNY
jgi:hypothetical protein